MGQPSDTQDAEHSNECHDPGRTHGWLAFDKSDQHDRPDVCFVEADDTVRNTSAVSVIENVLLTNQLAGHQQFTEPMPTCRQKGRATGDQSIDAGQSPLQMTHLLLNGLANLGDARALLLGYNKKLLPCFLTMCARLIPTRLSVLSMHCINQLLRDLPGLIKQREICWVSGLGWDARGINQ